MGAVTFLTLYIVLGRLIMTQFISKRCVSGSGPNISLSLNSGKRIGCGFCGSTPVGYQKRTKRVLKEY